MVTQFSKLADLVRADVHAYKEVALTAFSLHPTKERFDKLVELAAAVGEIATESDGEQVGSPWAILGLPKCLIMDIFNVARYCRWDLLTWREGWTHLEPLCQKYMAEKDEMTSVTEELNFVKVDYSRVKNMPRPERNPFWGIEGEPRRSRGEWPRKKRRVLLRQQNPKNFRRRDESNLNRKESKDHLIESSVKRFVFHFFFSPAHLINLFLFPVKFGSNTDTPRKRKIDSVTIILSI